VIAAHHIRRLAQVSDLAPGASWWEWECIAECTSERFTNEHDAADGGERHITLAAENALRSCTKTELAEALQAGASASDQTGLYWAVRMLDQHSYWIGRADIRPFVKGWWQMPDRPGRWWLTAWIEWEELLAAVDAATIHPGSTSERSILRIAASMSSPYKVSLRDETQSLGEGNRGLVLTALRAIL
jgi:hypothetical protein